MRYLLQVGSDRNHGSLLENTTYTRPPRLRSFSQLFRHKPSLLIYTRSPRSIYRLQVVQAQTTADYCRITGTPWIKYGVKYIGKRLKKFKRIVLTKYYNLKVKCVGVTKRALRCQMRE
jgi:hypothetical protein